MAEVTVEVTLDPRREFIKKARRERYRWANQVDHEAVVKFELFVEARRKAATS